MDARIIQNAISLGRRKRKRSDASTQPDRAREPVRHVSRNAYKGGERELLRELARLFRNRDYQ
jgi:hypothetical protein